MSSTLKIGSVLLQGGAFIPKSIWVEKETYCPGWQLITNLDGDELDRQIRDAYWNFMFAEGALAWEIFDVPKVLPRHGLPPAETVGLIGDHVREHVARAAPSRLHHP